MRWFIMACLVFLAACGANDKKEKNNATENNSAKPDSAIVINPVPFKKKDFPAGIAYKGNFEQAFKWTDKLGSHIFFTASVAPHAKKISGEDEFSSSAELYGYLFTDKGDGQYLQDWVLTKVEKDCPVDLTYEFIKDATTITDLDKNGIAEIKLQYRMACRGDVSPSDIILEIHEGDKLYMLSGYSWVPGGKAFDVTEQNANLELAPAMTDEMEKLYYSFGRYQDEKTFKDAPVVFLNYARSEWIKYAKENLGE